MMQRRICLLTVLIFTLSIHPLTEYQRNASAPEEETVRFW